MTRTSLSQVILGVRDLGAAAERIEALGLSVIDGGRHPGVGTANRYVPLGAEYFELLGVVDAEEAASSDYGRSLVARIAEGDSLVRWSLRTDDIDGVAARLDLKVERRRRLRPDGVLLTWRILSKQAQDSADAKLQAQQQAQQAQFTLDKARIDAQTQAVNAAAEAAANAARQQSLTPAILCQHWIEMLTSAKPTTLLVNGPCGGSSPSPNTILQIPPQK